MTSSNFTTLEATYRIVTPMFCSGADQKKTDSEKAGLRLASFKGALRFWWRTLMWGEVTDVKELHKKEAALFGSSDQKTGQSKVRMQLSSSDLKKEQTVKSVFEDGKLLGAHYLGYGVMEAFASKNKNTKAGQLTRPMIPGGTFTMEMRLAPSLGEEQKEQVINALILLGTVGGLGSKSRKGFGSLTLTKLDVDGKTEDLATCPKERIKKAIGKLKDGQPEWTAWSKESRMLLITSSEKRAVELLNQIGKEQVYYRSWGNKGTVIDHDREGNFKEDHDLSKGQPVGIKHPKRIAFGLPHNYGKGDSHAVSPVNKKEMDRRSSPLSIHLHQTSDDSKPIGIALFLPSRFLPEGEQIKAFGNNVPLDTSDDFWDPVTGYLDRLIEKPEATKKVQDDLQAEEYDLE